MLTIKPHGDYVWLPSNCQGNLKKIQEGNTALDWHLVYGVEATLLEAS